MSAVVTDPNSTSFSPTLPRDLDFEAAHARRQRFGDLPSLRPRLRLELLALALDLLLVAVGGEQRQLPRQEVVARVAVGDLDDLAALAEMVHVFSKNDFHRIDPLIRHVRNQRNLPGALDRHLELALVHRAGA